MTDFYHPVAHATPSPKTTWGDRIQPEALQQILCRPMYSELRPKLLAILQDPIYLPRYHLTLQENRQLTLDRLLRFAQGGFIHAMDVVENPSRFNLCLQVLHFIDYSLAIKAGVHYTLCGGTIAKLGTDYHHKKYLPLIDSLQLPGCFAMTELGHGSNVMGIETTATYDHATKTFDIWTPNDVASKFWIGGAALHAKVSTVFAQLFVDGENKGPHVFVVRLRDDSGKLMPGVFIKDNGPKMGLNGVDNGQIWFNHVKVPLVDMLNKYAQIDPVSGKYTSQFQSVSQLFGVTVGGLTSGRVLIAQAAVDCTKLGLTIASRYSCSRTQFGEKPIIEYLTQQRRIIPAIACTYALEFMMQNLKHLQDTKGDPKMIHVLSSSAKASGTWLKTKILQDCRECCGGMGVLAMNQIGPMIYDTNVDTTFEGDNTVLFQQVAKALLMDQKLHVSPTPIANPDFSLPGLLQLFQYRQHKLVATLAAKGLAAFEDNLDIVMQLGWAFFDLTSLHALTTEIKKASDPNVKAALTELALVHGYSRMEESLCFFALENLLNRNSAEHVRNQVNQLCAKLSADDGVAILNLCKGFGIPEQFITAPIAGNWKELIISKL